MSDSSVRALLVGCGGMSGAWLGAAATLDDVEIVGLVDLDADRALARRDEYELSQAQTGTDMVRLLEELRPDVVFDCTVPEAHTHVTTTALEHGCHVLGEKPLADSMANARAALEAARKANRIYAVIQNRRYDPNIRRLRRLLDSDAIGPLTSVDADFYLGAHFGGFRAQMDHVLLLDMAIHTFDAARLISGADPVRVYCREWNSSGSWFAHGSNAVAVFEMTDGIVFTYRGSWCAEGMNTTWESNWRIVGERGSVLWDGGEGIHGESVIQSGDFRSEMSPLTIPDSAPDDRIGHHTGLMREFIDRVRHGGEPETVARDNIKSLAMVFGAIDSASEGREIAIDL
ncbi:MAG: Gfo/Idh/MocA family oxidoreductase [Candidatus Latescibacterota bacterium]|nr:Gfo/Idh/MocA family oxidoreductase [Candidatus Latescibacterota bacterium]